MMVDLQARWQWRLLVLSAHFLPPLDSLQRAATSLSTLVSELRFFIADVVGKININVGIEVYSQECIGRGVCGL